MGFDAIHMTDNKTFSTPTRRRPGAGAVGVSERCCRSAFHMIEKRSDGNSVSAQEERPNSLAVFRIRRNAGVLLRAYVYARMLGSRGMHRVASTPR